MHYDIHVHSLGSLVHVCSPLLPSSLSLSLLPLPHSSFSPSLLPLSLTPSSCLLFFLSPSLLLLPLPPFLPPSLLPFPPLCPSLFQEAFQEFQTLEDRITYVATKVVHLGDQLESSNNRCMRAVEARELMKYLDEFRTRIRPNIAVFTDPGRVSVHLSSELLFSSHHQFQYV